MKTFDQVEKEANKEFAEALHHAVTKLILGSLLGSKDGFAELNEAQQKAVEEYQKATKE